MAHLSLLLTLNAAVPDQSFQRIVRAVPCNANIRLAKNIVLCYTKPTAIRLTWWRRHHALEKFVNPIKAVGINTAMTAEPINDFVNT